MLLDGVFDLADRGFHGRPGTEAESQCWHCSGVDCCIDKLRCMPPQSRDLQEPYHVRHLPIRHRQPRLDRSTCAPWRRTALRQLADRGRLPHDPEQPDPEVAENPDALVVYGGIGKAHATGTCFDAILDSLRKLKEDEKRCWCKAASRWACSAPIPTRRVLLANSNLVPKWATWEHFNELDRKGLMMYGQMTAGSWIYIGSQGIVQGTYETFVEAGRQHYNGSLAGRWI